VYPDFSRYRNICPEGWIGYRPDIMKDKMTIIYAIILPVTETVSSRKNQIIRDKCPGTPS